MAAMIYPAERALRLEKITIQDLLPGEKVILAEVPTENRGELDLWTDLKQHSPERIILLNRLSNDKIEFKTINSDRKEAFLTDPNDLKAIFNGDRFLIDITVLRHSVWAPLIKYVRAQDKETRVLYVEPKEYKDHPNPSSDTKFDLTTHFESSLPLAGFSQLLGPEDENKCLFVTMLGFEGSRPIRLLSEIEPAPTVVPIIGVPGFELEYPTYAVTCNKTLLMDASHQSELRYAKASCPFEAYNVLKDIQRDFPGYYMYIAPVGTKPHALGAILYAIDNPANTEILYDHPIGKKGRTAGRTIINIYNIKKIK
jgi:hypothetical protein